MTDQNSFPNPGFPQMPPSEPQRSHSERWLPGVILIVMGGIFLIGNLTGFVLHNWWALFILIPAYGAFARAYDRYHQSGRLDEQARQALIGGIILTGVASIFLFNLSWTLLGPVILILIGASLLSREWLQH